MTKKFPLRYYLSFTYIESIRINIKNLIPDIMSEILIRFLRSSNPFSYEEQRIHTNIVLILSDPHFDFFFTNSHKPPATLQAQPKA